MKNHLFRGLLLASAALCLNAIPTAWAQAPAPIAEALQPYVDRHALAGAVTLVASRDAVLDLEAVGYADIAGQKAMPTNAIFWIASMTKPMTGTALMMLVDEGKVNLDDPVEKYLPEFRGQMVIAEQDADHIVLKKPAHPITVKEVLSHTSGLPFSIRTEKRYNYEASRAAAPEVYAKLVEGAPRKVDMLQLRAAVLGYALTPLQTQPGTRYEYSNAGINTAGRIIEVVSGMPYEEFMKRRLFQPLGMVDTGFRLTKEQAPRLAKAYKPDAAKTGLEETKIDQLSYPLTDRTRTASPAGGLFSTAADVAQLCRMILNGGTLNGKRYLSEAAVKRMTSTQTGQLKDVYYGVGWATTAEAAPADSSVGGFCGHTGAYSTQMWIDPKSQLVMVYMVQHNGYPGEDGGKIYPAFEKAAVERFGKKP